AGSGEVGRPSPTIITPRAVRQSLCRPRRKIVLHFLCTPSLGAALSRRHVLDQGFQRNGSPLPVLDRDRVLTAKRAQPALDFPAGLGVSDRSAQGDAEEEKDYRPNRREDDDPFHVTCLP